MQKNLIIVLLVAVIALAGVIVYQKITPSTPTPIIINQPVVNQSKDFNNSQYKVSLKYPASWTTDQKYDNTSYAGQSGYFSISAGFGGSISLDEAYKLDAYHKLKPYGTEPKIEDLIIDGQKAKLILPSQDQDSSMNRQAEIVVAYPNGPISIDAGSSYYYFILHADENHIKEIAQTIKFSK